MPMYDDRGTRQDIPLRLAETQVQVRRIPFTNDRPQDKLFLTGPEGTGLVPDDNVIKQPLDPSSGQFTSNE